MVLRNTTGKTPWRLPPPPLSFPLFQAMLACFREWPAIKGHYFMKLFKEPNHASVVLANGGCAPQEPLLCAAV